MFLITPVLSILTWSIVQFCSWPSSKNFISFDWSGILSGKLSPCQPCIDQTFSFWHTLTCLNYIQTPKLFKYCIFPSPRTLLSYCSSTNTKINESLSQPYHEAYQDSKQSKSSIKHNNKLKPTLDEGPGSNLLGTNLDRFEANWILELDYTLVPSLILGSPNHELSF